jgi:hypothetical protein
MDNHSDCRTRLDIRQSNQILSWSYTHASRNRSKLTKEGDVDRQSLPNRPTRSLFLLRTAWPVRQKARVLVPIGLLKHCELHQEVYHLARPHSSRGGIVISVLSKALTLFEVHSRWIGMYFRGPRLMALQAGCATAEG